jgi:2-iminobutanoate/2-iminopropanoate deaminase
MNKVTSGQQESTQPDGSSLMSEAAAEDTILLTIFLKHDQSKNLEGIQGHLSEHAWWERFPPAGVEIVSWNVVMGIGQIVTLRLPSRLLNVVNVEIERSAWGVFTTEFYPTYDFIPVRERIAREWREARAKAVKT